MSNTQVFLSVLVIALVTAGIRFLPFLLFSGKRRVPTVITYLGKVLPYAVMGMLLVYCLKDPLAEGLVPSLKAFGAALVVAGLHIWKRNSLLSIVGGTVCYMLLVQLL